MNIFDILQMLIDKGGSDIHLVIGTPPTLRIDGELEPIQGLPELNEEALKTLIYPLMEQEQQDYVKVNKELDFAYQYKDQGRFRINVYHSQGALCAALRLIPSKIRKFDELNLPPIFEEFTKYKQGLVLLTGPTGEGKSTTLAAMIDTINETRAEHIVTIEDPIEFIYEPKMSIISQREINHDTHGWDIALRSVLREDPDVVLIGEMRDFETIASAITISETGHLVFATLHTSSVSQTVDRIIDVFPAHQQEQVRQQLAETLKVVVSQRLLKRIGGGRVPAVEIMIVNSAIRNLIREAKTHQIDNIIQTSKQEGMILIEENLADLYRKGLITKEDAYRTAFRYQEIHRLLD